MGYEAPIQMQTGEIIRRVCEEQDKKIYEAVLECGINVSKEELVKALNYDRDQYVKGYEDGKADAMQWIPCSERLPEEKGDYLVTSKGSIWVANWFNYTWWGIEKHCRWTDVEAWMPLPEPYKEEEKE